MSKSSVQEKGLTAQHGDLHTVIPDMVTQHGQEETARKLGVKQAWVSRWLQRNGYKRVIQWVREEENSCDLQPA